MILKLIWIYNSLLITTYATMAGVFTNESVKSAYESWKATALRNDNVIFMKPSMFLQSGLLCAMNTAEMDEEKRRWRTLAREGKVTIRFVNSKSRALNDGREWHFFVLQPTNPDECGPDPFGMFVLGEMVSGFIYAFKSKKHRDRIQEYVMKGLPQMECRD